MQKKLTIVAVLLLAALPLQGQNWSIGAGTGAFVFGDFVERRIRPIAGGEAEEPTIQTLSAGTRPGLAVDIERSFGDRWAVRLEGTFTHAPLSITEESSETEEFEFEAGALDVTTFMVPIVFRINPRGALRFHVTAGPAYAIYRAEGRENVEGSIAVFEGTRGQWGAAAGLGAAWYLSNRFAIEGAITDIVTSSPFDRSDFPDVPGFSIPKPHNVHTTVGLRYRF